MEIRRAAIVGGARIPFVKSFTQYRDDTNQELMTYVLKALAQRYRLAGKRLGDVVSGAVMKHASDWNLTRECVLGSGLDPHTPAHDLQRACGTSLEAAIGIANKIALSQIEVGIAAGTDTNSDLPLTFNRKLARTFAQSVKGGSLIDKLTPWRGIRAADLKPQMPAVVEPRTGLSMGQHCERMAKEWKISREEQDQLALKSHQNAAAAYERGFYKELVVEYHGLRKDPLLRADTSLEKLAKLKPAFDPQAGTITAGNASALSDGAAATLLASEDYAKQNGLPVLAYFRDAAVAAVDFVGGEGLLMAPTGAVAELLNRNRLKLQDFDFYEIHEAFAAQVLCTLKAWESNDYCRRKLGLDGALGAIDRNKLNVAGSSLALGHPFAATGARIVATLAKLIDEKKGGRGLISICTAGGMGVAAILEK